MNTRARHYQLVVGFTGPIASGKGLAVEAIQAMFEGKESVRSVLLSDYIREVVREEQKPLTRDTLREAGNARRKKMGPGAWVEKMLAELPEDDEGILLVDSIRNPGEIAAIRKAFGDRTFVIATDAPLEDRIARVLKRAREEDSAVREEIVRQMEVEMERNPEFGFDLHACREMADLIAPSRESKAEKIAEIQSELRAHMTRFEGGEAQGEFHRAA